MLYLHMECVCNGNFDKDDDQVFLGGSLISDRTVSLWLKNVVPIGHMEIWLNQPA